MTSEVKFAWCTMLVLEFGKIARACLQVKMECGKSSFKIFQRVRWRLHMVKVHFKASFKICGQSQSCTIHLHFIQ